MAYKLYPYQEPIAGKVFDYIRKHPGEHPLVALPTGSGKSLIIADVVNQAIHKWPNTYILILSHVKEILQQNHDKLIEQTGMDIGLYSSGLKTKTIKQVTVAGIQSVWRIPEAFTKYRLIIIDEAHLIPHKNEGMYRTFFDKLHNPVYFGLTATPYRLGGGYIYGDDKETLFNDLIIDLTYMEAFNKLVEDGYLSELRVQHTTLNLDVEGLHKRGGEFIDKEMSDKFDKQYITDMAIKEILKAGEPYKKWLVFAIDIEHAEHITETLIANGIKAYIVHSKMGDKNRDHVLQMFRTGQLSCLVNVNIATTGLDIPDIDLIALLRPTHSPVFHVQTIGRGLRIAAGKTHCLVLDFAGNTERLGAINDIRVRKPNKSDEPGEAVTKRCPECNLIYHPTAKLCICGYEFKFKTLLTMKSAGKQVVQTTKRFWHEVTDVKYELNVKKNSPTSVKVSYHCGLRIFKQWVCVEHNGYAGHIAKHWVRVRGGVICETANDLMNQVDSLDVPVRIHVDERSKYPSIIGFDFNRK